MYVQAIPLYTNEDVGPSTYFTGFRKEIDEITGTALVIVYPETVSQGNAADLGKVLDEQTRYNGLRRSDLPCLWVEAEGGHFLIPLPAEHDAIKLRLRKLADAASAATTLKELESAMTESSNQSSDHSATHGNPWGYAVMSIVLLAITIGLLVFLGRPNTPADLGRRIYFVVLLIGGLAAAGFLFGAMRSFARFVGKQSNAYLELGGPVVAFFLVIILGFQLTRDDGPLDITVRVLNAERDPVAGATVRFRYEKRSDTRTTNADGEVHLAGLPRADAGKDAEVVVRAEGYKPSQGKYKLAGTIEVTLVATGGAVAIPPSDIVVAAFAQRGGEPMEIAGRIDGMLRQTVQTRGFKDLRISLTATSPVDDSSARKLLQEQGATLLVWGWYDAAGVQIRLQGSDAEVTSQPYEIAWEAAETPPLRMAIAREAITNDVRFLALAALGELLYLRNEYAAGRAVVDDAVANLPATTKIVDVGLWEYFRGRAMQSAGAADDDVACAYGAAIRANQHILGAWNNLGILFAQRYEADDDAPPCLAAIDILSPHAAAVFERAIELFPTSAVLRYNLWAYRWDGGAMEGEFETDDFARAFEDVLKVDPTIPGAHLVLGIIAANREDLAAAEQRFRTAHKLLPSLRGIQFNIAQICRRQGRAACVWDALKHETIPEAHVLAALLTNDIREIHQHLDRVPEAAFVDAFGGVGVFLRADVYQRAGQYARAADTLESALRRWKEYFAPEYDRRIDLGHYAAHLLRRAAGMKSSHLDYPFNDGMNVAPEDDAETVPTSGYDDARTNNEPVAAAWFALARRCHKQRPITTWGPPCLPNNIATQLQTVFSEIYRATPFYLMHRQSVMAGLACPIVFTRRSSDDEWQMAGPIIVGALGRANETTQVRSLPQFSGEVLIREVEPEHSFIDEISLQCTVAGALAVHVPQNELLARVDGRRYNLRRGGELYLNFGKSTASSPCVIRATGYYIREDPYHRTPK